MGNQDQNLSQAESKAEELGFLDYFFTIGMVKFGLILTFMLSASDVIKAAFDLQKLSIDRFAQIMGVSLVLGAFYGYLLWIGHVFSRKNKGQ
jgi:cytochrome c oxidase subunit IV